MTKELISELRELATSIFNEMEEEAEEEFQDFVNNPCFDTFQQLTYACFHSVDCTQGMSRAVLIPIHFHYVFKISYCDLSKDYCHKEVKVFKEAEKLGLAKFFAETDYIGEIKGLKIYAQVRADVDEDENEEALANHIGESGEYDENSMDEIYDLISSRSGEDNMRELLEYEYGSEEISKLWNLCYRLKVNDLHGGNIGKLNDNFVLVDYAGYDEN